MLADYRIRCGVLDNWFSSRTVHVALLKPLAASPKFMGKTLRKGMCAKHTTTPPMVLDLRTCSDRRQHPLRRGLWLRFPPSNASCSNLSSRVSRVTRHSSLGSCAVPIPLNLTTFSLLLCMRVLWRADCKPAKIGKMHQIWSPTGHFVIHRASKQPQERRCHYD